MRPMTLRVPATSTFAACLLLGAITSGAAIAAPDAAVLPRLPLALAFALFVPGYLLVCTLFPEEDDLGHLLRLGLAPAGSFALIILVTLGLSVSPVSRSATAELLAMDGLVLLLAATATLRQRRQPPATRLRFSVTTGDGSLLRNRFTLIALAFAIVLIVAAVVGTVDAGQGPTTALSIPAGGQTNPIEADGITVDVESHESAPINFQLVVSWEGQVIGRSSFFSLVPNGQAETHVSTTPPPGTDPVPVDVILFKQGDPVPFRRLRVWMRTMPYRIPS
jgi:hypothetical protein